MTFCVKDAKTKQGVENVRMALVGGRATPAGSAAAIEPGKWSSELAKVKTHCRKPETQTHKRQPKRDKAREGERNSRAQRSTRCCALMTQSSKGNNIYTTITIKLKADDGAETTKCD